MFARQLFVVMLLFSAVPAGCLPLLTVGAAVDEVRAVRNPPRGRHPNAAKSGWIFVVVCSVLSVVVALLFRRQLKRADDPDRGPADLSTATKRALLWIAFGMGVIMGASMIAFMQT